MGVRKKGVNNNDKNFIRRCVEDEVDWDITRIAAHLGCEEGPVQEFYTHFENGGDGKHFPEKQAEKAKEPKKEKKAKKSKAKKEDTSAEEEFS
jgi:actin-related protein